VETSGFMGRTSVFDQKILRKVSLIVAFR